MIEFKSIRRLTVLVEDTDDSLISIGGSAFNSTRKIHIYVPSQETCPELFEYTLRDKDTMQIGLLGITQEQMEEYEEAALRKKVSIGLAIDK